MKIRGIMKDLIEIPQQKELIYKGNYLEYHRDHVLLPNGKISTREYLQHPGAIAVVPLLDTGEVVMVKQFRYATGQVVLEIPAGKLEPGENPLNAARRELIEEISYEPGQMIHLTSIWTTPGFTDEIIHLYLAKALKPCPGHMDEDEFLEVVTLNKPELLELLHSSDTIDGKTALALSLVQLRGLW
jgi:ADP-ribose pyrophosphatase